MHLLPAALLSPRLLLLLKLVVAGSARWLLSMLQCLLLETLLVRRIVQLAAGVSLGLLRLHLPLPVCPLQLLLPPALHNQGLQCPKGGGMS